MNEPSTITLRINERDRRVAVPARTTLLEVLRDQLGLTGVKLGCNQGVCGACTVLADGVPVRACLLLAHACGGTRIITVEGLAGHERLTHLQKAFAECGAVQCGFCTSGMLISAYALLEEIPRPSTEQIRQGLGGNLCRCTGYVKIVEAVSKAAALECQDHAD